MVLQFLMRSRCRIVVFILVSSCYSHQKYTLNLLIPPECDWSTNDSSSSPASFLSLYSCYNPSSKSSTKSISDFMFSSCYCFTGNNNLQDGEKRLESKKSTHTYIRIYGSSIVCSAQYIIFDTDRKRFIPIFLS